MTMPTPMDKFRTVAWQHSAPGNLASDSGVATVDNTSDIDFDDWLHRTAYEATPAPDTSTPDLEPSRSLQDPSPTESIFTPTPPRAITPCIANNTYAINGDYFPAAEPVPLEQVNSKKRPGRTQTGLSVLAPLAKKRSQRKKKIEGGFPCREGCGKFFDRECDENKHFERGHRDERYWPHECIYCPKRSQYPKDVWRHLEQTHHMKVPAKEPASLRRDLGCPCCKKTASDWIEAHNLAIEPPVQAVTSPEPISSSPTSPNILWTLTQSIMKLRRLSLNKTKEPKFIMVTTDKKDFSELDVSNIGKAEVLIQRIVEALKLDESTEVASIQSYSRKTGLGQLLDSESLLSTVAKSADADSSLRFFITTK